MGCILCGDGETVRSHIIPRAFAHDVRDGAKHVVTGSRFEKVPRTSQSGFFSSTMLCSTHENLTAPIDKYAIEFVRRVTDGWVDRTSTSALAIANPRPDLLRSFALLTIWREVHSGTEGTLSLGPYEQVIRNHLFDGGASPDWAIVVQRTNFVTPGRGAIDFNLHPYRVRFADRAGWMLTVAGVGFFVVSDRRGLPSRFQDWRVDCLDPAPVTISEPLPFTEVGALKGILAAMAARARA
ncbi:hypothetical protein C8J25_108184 [Sphingomonas faeni]|uniref:Uncharacterized protein n=1 Tax=Sphingomonas faeni TaxID=185950 RepID=A0A2T5U0R6_9SPHN|nr:hypothetical protein C8J25_108184 [Sphingomonas faeni]